MAGLKIPIIQSKPLKPDSLPYYSSAPMFLQRDPPLLIYEEEELKESDHSSLETDFAALITKHMTNLCHHLSSGATISPSDMFMAIYSVKLMEDPHLMYTIQLNQTQTKPISFEEQTVSLNPMTFINTFERSFTQHKLIYLVYVGLAVHYYVNVHMNRPGNYTLDITCKTLNQPTYVDMFETILSLLFHNPPKDT